MDSQTRQELRRRKSRKELVKEVRQVRGEIKRKNYNESEREKFPRATSGGRILRGFHK